ncbi:S-adenosyl-L-methionine-dependent methyltransferase [Lasiosphaeris hirsuta]|uniref:S-adenosyl-L-methionine-dependent methyltransferase n=1 Tax=Lasiosphaeris hirsuta TaxID=260670 RepID=A0AA40ASA2_9PEZI|nr:S-adenosyl-L-methionine-dependent methyltransferase [Lasiosphaeris hirsuta]
MLPAPTSASSASRPTEFAKDSTPPRPPTPSTTLPPLFSTIAPAAPTSLTPPLPPLPSLSSLFQFEPPSSEALPPISTLLPSESLPLSLPPPEPSPFKPFKTKPLSLELSCDSPGPSAGPSPPVHRAEEPESHSKGRAHDHQQDSPRRADIEAAAEDDVEDEDEFAITDGYDTRSSKSTSATSTIYAHTFENGRRYQHFKNGRYPIPNDDLELNREDMKHAMLLELTDGKLFYAPIGDNPQSILDIGTGTGVWAMDVGDQFPSARVRGVDLSPTQPQWVPPNVDFLVDDCEKDDWLARDVDLVHLRFMIIILKDVPTVLKRGYESLKPGGWIELQELCAEVLCEDGTMPDNDPVKYTYELAAQAFAKFGMRVTLPKDLEPLLRDAGYENIQCVVKKVPIGVWARDKTMRLIGMYQKMAVLDLLPAVAGRPFAALGMSEIESQVTIAHTRRGLNDASVHRYFHYYFWFAQKPFG